MSPDVYDDIPRGLSQRKSECFFPAIPNAIPYSGSALPSKINPLVDGNRW